MRGPGSVHRLRAVVAAAALGAAAPPAATPVAAQETGAVAGRVRDAAGAAIFAASVTVRRPGGPAAGAAGVDTDRLGFFRLDGLAPGAWSVRVERLGYRTEEREAPVEPGATTRVDFTLAEAPVELEGVSVDAERDRARIRFDEVAGVTAREMSAEELRIVPGVAEADPLRAIAVLPGVVSTSDLSSAFHVRGGSADQNLVTLDGVPVFTPFHLGGFFSVFNADMVERAELHVGGFPARFGGRVSSVLEVASDPGDGGFAVEGGVSALAARVALQGRLPGRALDALGLRSARWKVGARRSYFDVLLRPVFDFPYHLTDVQLRGEAWTSGGDRIDVTAYTGDDVLDLTRLEIEDFPLRIDWRWGNDLAGVRWTHPWAAGGSLALAGSATRFASGLDFPDFDDTEFRTRIEQLAVRADLDVRPAPRWRVGLGVGADHHRYDNLARTGGTVFGEGFGEGWLLGGYGQVEWRQPGAWIVEAGLRADRWVPEPGEPILQLAPRVAVKRFFGGGRWAVKAAAGRYGQFLHSLRDEELPIGLDVWILAGDRAPALVSDQAQLGVEAFPADGWEVALEGYWRSFDGTVSLDPADDPNTDLDDVIEGRGVSWGADLFVKRTSGPVNGWLSLSFLRARRTFPDPLSPLEPRPEIDFAPVFDRRLDADLVLSAALPGRWVAGLRWNVGTGIPFTRPVGAYALYRPDFILGDGRFEWVGADSASDDLGGNAILLGGRNATRYPVYHRLDVSLRRRFRTSWAELTPHLDVLNVYNRKNVLFYFFEFDRSPPTRSGISMFPFLPTVGLEVAFR